MIYFWRGRKYRAMEMDNNNGNNGKNVWLSEVKSNIILFFKNNKTLVFALPILLVLVIVLIVVYSNQGIKSAVADLPNKGVSSGEQVLKSGSTQTEGKVEVLPQKVRTDEQEQDKTGAAPLNNPFEQPMVLSGLLLDENGDNIAIIESGAESYVVMEGDIVGEYWIVGKIGEDGVVLNNGEKETVIQLESR